VYPPNFKCVQNDTLRWEAFNNTCGIFQRYLVYGSQSRTGPYVQIAAITDINITFFYHQHPVNETWYYFMQSRYDCPGQPIFNSDTLDGQAPLAPIIQSVSVENNKAVVEWSLSKDKRIAGYIIYRQTPLGIKPIDTVYSATKFTDLNSFPDKQLESYYVLALSKCGGTSLFGQSHQSIQVKVQQDECERQAILKWNKYKSWSGGIARHEIWVKQGNLPYEKVDTVAANDTIFIYNGLKNNQKYCFYVRSVQKNDNRYAAKTNEVCIVGNVVASTEFVIIKNVEVNTKNEVSFTWIWNNDADLDSIKIKRAVDGKVFTDISSLPVKNYLAENTFTDKNPIGQEREFYGIYSVDICQNFAFAPFFTLDLKGKPQDNRSNLLTWGDHHIKTGKKEYELFRIVNGVESKIWDTEDKHEFVDPFDPLNPDNAIICYYVVAYAYDTLPNKKPIKVRSKSNTVCVSQTASIFTPNAFAPRGINQEFRPLISFSDQLASYSMVIFDRYGAKVFETTDLDKGWNGKVENTGRELSQGTYVYYIKTVQKNGKQNEVKGTVTLLR
jgi:gliding motility-associated-like protein